MLIGSCQNLHLVGALFLLGERTVESSMPHKTSTSSVVKNAGGKAAGGKAAITIQTWMVSFFYYYIYRDFLF